MKKLLQRISRTYWLREKDVCRQSNFVWASEALDHMTQNVLMLRQHITALVHILYRLYKGWQPGIAAT
jgi:hypothetical protein